MKHKQYNTEVKLKLHMLWLNSMNEQYIISPVMSRSDPDVVLGMHEAYHHNDM